MAYRDDEEARRFGAESLDRMAEHNERLEERIKQLEEENSELRRHGEVRASRIADARVDAAVKERAAELADAIVEVRIAELVTSMEERRAAEIVDAEAERRIAERAEALRAERAAERRGDHPVFVDESLWEYATNILEMSRSPKKRNLGRFGGYILSGAGAGDEKHLVHAARARATEDGREHVIIADIGESAPALLRERLILRAGAAVDGVTIDSVIDKILGATPVP